MQDSLMGCVLNPILKQPTITILYLQQSVPDRCISLFPEINILKKHMNNVGLRKYLIQFFHHSGGHDNQQKLKTDRKTGSISQKMQYQVVDITCGCQPINVLGSQTINIDQIFTDYAFQESKSSFHLHNQTNMI